MNTRLQVEHPVTEMITGLDLVQEQIRVAAGADAAIHPGATSRSPAMPSSAASMRRTPTTFAPSPGRVDAVHFPGGLGVRVDSALYAGYRIPPYYDSLIGKLIVFGKTRTECMMRLKRAMGEFVIEGIETTIPLFQQLAGRTRHHRRALRHPLAGELSRAACLDDAPSRHKICCSAYAGGIFPMAESAEDNALYWVEPDERGIIPLDGPAHFALAAQAGAQAGRLRSRIDYGIFRGH